MVSRGPAGGGKLPKKADTGDILNRLRVSYTALRASKVDAALRGLLIAELITQVFLEGGALVIPNGMRVQTISNDKYAEYKSTLSGLNEGNVGNVAVKLVELGLNPDAGAISRTPDWDVRMVPEYETQKRLK